MTQKEKAEALRSLHAVPRILVLPNAWDAASARIFEDAGFPAVGTTSAGVAFALGYPDGQHVPREEALFMIGRIAATVGVPVTADIEAGYGADSVEQVLETVRGVLAAGAVGLNLEDGAGGDALTDSRLQADKISAIRSLGESAGIPLVINARTDAFRLAALTTKERMEEAVRRLNAYHAAGADCLFAPFLKDATTIAVLVSAVDGPLNVLATAGAPPVAELERLGVRRVSVGGGPSRAALGLVRRIARELRDAGTYELMTTDAVPYDEMNRLLHFH